MNAIPIPERVVLRPEADQKEVLLFSDRWSDEGCIVVPLAYRTDQDRSSANCSDLIKAWYLGVKPCLRKPRGVFLLPHCVYAQTDLPVRQVYVDVNRDLVYRIELDATISDRLF